MKKILYVLLVSCIGLTIIISCSSSSDEDDIVEITTTDTTAATLAEVTAVTTPTNDTVHQTIHFHHLKQGQSHMEVPVLQVLLLQPQTIIPSL